MAAAVGGWLYSAVLVALLAPQSHSLYCRRSLNDYSALVMVCVKSSEEIFFDPPQQIIKLMAVISPALTSFHGHQLSSEFCYPLNSSAFLCFLNLPPSHHNEPIRISFDLSDTITVNWIVYQHLPFDQYSPESLKTYESIWESHLMSDCYADVRYSIFICSDVCPYLLGVYFDNCTSPHWRQRKLEDRQMYDVAADYKEEVVFETTIEPQHFSDIVKDKEVVFVTKNHSLTLHCVETHLGVKRDNLESFIITMPETSPTKELSQDQDKLKSKDDNIYLHPSNATVHIHRIDMKLYGAYKCGYKERVFNKFLGEKGEQQAIRYWKEFMVLPHWCDSERLNWGVDCEFRCVCSDKWKVPIHYRCNCTEFIGRMKSEVIQLQFIIFTILLLLVCLVILFVCCATDPDNPNQNVFWGCLQSIWNALVPESERSRRSQGYEPIEGVDDLEGEANDETEQPEEAEEESKIEESEVDQAEDNGTTGEATMEGEETKDGDATEAEEEPDGEAEDQAAEPEENAKEEGHEEEAGEHEGDVAAPGEESGDAEEEPKEEEPEDEPKEADAEEEAKNEPSEPDEDPEEAKEEPDVDGEQEGQPEDEEPKEEPEEDAKDEPEEDAKEEPEEDAKDEPEEDAKEEPEEDAKEEPEEDAKGEPEEDAKSEPEEDAKGEPEEDAKDEPEEDAKGEPEEDAKGEPEKKSKEDEMEESTEKGLQDIAKEHKEKPNEEPGKEETEVEAGQEPKEEKPDETNEAKDPQVDDEETKEPKDSAKNSTEGKAQTSNGEPNKNEPEKDGTGEKPADNDGTKPENQSVQDVLHGMQKGKDASETETAGKGEIKEEKGENLIEATKESKQDVKEADQKTDEKEETAPLNEQSDNAEPGENQEASKEGEGEKAKDAAQEEIKTGEENVVPEENTKKKRKKKKKKKRGKSPQVDPDAKDDNILLSPNTEEKTDASPTGSTTDETPTEETKDLKSDPVELQVPKVVSEQESPKADAQKPEQTATKDVEPPKPAETKGTKLETEVKNTPNIEVDKKKSSIPNVGQAANQNPVSQTMAKTLTPENESTGRKTESPNSPKKK